MFANLFLRNEFFGMKLNEDIRGISWETRAIELILLADRSGESSDSLLASGRLTRRC